MLDFGSGPFTNLIPFNPFQSSQSPKAASVSRIPKQTSAGDDSSMPIDGTSPMPTEGMSSMLMDGLSPVPMESTSPRPVDGALSKLTSGSSQIPVVIAQGPESGQRRLDTWLQPQSTPSNGTSVVTQRIYENKQAKMTQTRFEKANRPHFKKSSVMNI